MSTGLKAGVFVVFLCMAASSLFAQSQAVNGVIEGKVVDGQGAGLPGTTVAIRNEDTGFEREVRTDQAGRYRAVLLPLGSYELAARRQGFSPVRRSGLVLELAQTLTVGFTLQPGSEDETSMATGPAGLETDRKQPSTTINKRFAESLPLSGRKFLDLGVMVPGATEFGERDTSATADFAGVNHFYSNMQVDGADAFQAWSNFARGKFLVPFEFSQNAIREFQVLNGNFTAEFGRSGGGLISAVTRSGSNSWHGDGFYYLSDSAMNARPRFSQIKPDSRQQQFGGALGGPVKRDRAFVFANYDQLVRTDPMIVTTGTVLDGFETTLAAMRDSQERQRFQEAGQFIRSLTGDFTRDLDQRTFLIRADWQLNASQSLSARWNLQDFTANNVPENEFNIPIVSGSAVNNNGRATVRNHSLSMQWVASFSPQLLNEARFQLALGRERATPNGQGPQIRIGSRNSGVTFGQRETLPSSLSEDRWQWIDNITWMRGRHELKAGLDIQRISDQSSFLSASAGVYQFGSLRDFANGRYETYTQGFGIAQDSTVNPYYSFFVQDNFRVSSSLSINLGVRYEFQDLDSPSLSNPQFPLTAQIPRDGNNVAPRFGLAWAPWNRSLVVRASYGVYYGPLPLQVNSVAKTQNGVFQTIRQFRGPADRRGPSSGAPIYPAVFAADPNPQTPTAGAQIIAFDAGAASPYIQQVNFEIERELFSSVNVSSGWLYSKGTKLRRNDDLNLFLPGSRQVEILDSSRNISGLVTIPFFGGPASRPFPFFDRITEFKFDGNSVYHAFYVQANKRYSHGLQLLFNYTLSKLIDLGQAPGNQINCCNSENPFAASDERGLGRRDQRHRVNVAAVWDLPNVSKGGPVTAGLLQDWRLSTIVRAGSGRPYSPTVTGDSGGDVNGDGLRGDRAPLFGRSSFIGPGYASLDAGIQRLVRLGESKNLRFILEGFNLLNRANYLRPSSEYFSLTNVTGGPARLTGPLPTFGRPFDATRSRELQIAVRFEF